MKGITSTADSRAIKEAGHRWEVAVEAYLNEQELRVTRRRQRGRVDAGDLFGPDAWVMGCKNERILRLSYFMDQMDAQVENDGGERFGVEFVKRRGYPTAKAYAIMTVETWTAVARRIEELEKPGSLRTCYRK